jgi:NarL family two-component system response regulator LiaR
MQLITHLSQSASSVWSGAAAFCGTSKIGKMKPIRLLVIDDHTVVRRGLRRYIELLPGMELAAEASNGLEALALAPSTAPDVIITDVMMPEMDGIAAVTALRQLLPHTPILVLTTFCARETILAALRAGANGFLLKDVGIDELALAIRTVLAGQPYLQPRVPQQLIESSLGEASPLVRLTAREQQIAALVGCGMSNKQIAAELRISEKTISVHVSNLMAKLNLRSRTQLALYALQPPTSRAQFGSAF